MACSAGMFVLPWVSFAAVAAGEAPRRPGSIDRTDAYAHGGAEETCRIDHDSARFRWFGPEAAVDTCRRRRPGIGAFSDFAYFLAPDTLQ